MSCPATRSAEECSEQRLVDASRLVALGELAAGVAHNFGNVLMGVSVTLELLQMKAAREPDLSDMVETIEGAQAEVDRGAEIIQRLLSLSRGRPDFLTSVNPWLAADSALALCSTHTKAKQVKLVNLIPSDPPWVKADATQLQEVLVNLILNALQASDQGQIEVALSECDDWVSISVTDDGCGIEPEAIDKLFDPFYSKRKDGLGTGLGLPCSLSQVTKMGGTIEVESKAGVGSTFTIMLQRWLG